MPLRRSSHLVTLTGIPRRGAIRLRPQRSHVMMRQTQIAVGAFVLAFACVVSSVAIAQQPAAPAAAAGEKLADYVLGKLVQLNDNGAWSWFMDPRAIVHEGKLVVGSVRAVKTFDAG